MQARFSYQASSLFIGSGPLRIWNPFSSILIHLNKFQAGPKTFSISHTHTCRRNPEEDTNWISNKKRRTQKLLAKNVVTLAVMDLIIPTSHTHEGLCSFQYFIRDTTRRSSFAGARIRGNVGSTRKIHVGLRKLRKSRVFAVSEVETFHSNGKLQNHDKPLNGHMGNGHVSSSSIEEFESNNHLRKLVRNGELEEGFRFLESMVYRGEIPDIIASTSLIRGFLGIARQERLIML
ncbi:hypothetical protein OIU76_007372 [Salix suchowensis]|nr:hypothetical protein OIU76_007372 [Salix suchowensis]